MKKISFIAITCLCLFSLDLPPFISSKANNKVVLNPVKKDSIDYTALYKHCKIKEQEHLNELFQMASSTDTVILTKIKIKTDSFYSKPDTVILVKGLFGKLKPLEKEETIDSTQNI